MVHPAVGRTQLASTCPSTFSLENDLDLATVLKGFYAQFFPSTSCFRVAFLFLENLVVNMGNNIN